MEFSIICDNLLIIVEYDYEYMQCKLRPDEKLGCLFCNIGQVMVIP